MYVLLAFLALSIERLTGYPDWLFRRIGHPVTWMGALIAALDRRINRDADDGTRRRLSGIAAVIVVTTAFALPALVLHWVFGSGASFIALALLASSLSAQRSLDQHVVAVADALDTGCIVAGRAAVSRIVGRDPESLDEAGIARAAIESLSENFSDGVVAPAFWIATAGLAGGVAYKAINTADSMVGHRTPRHSDFGWAAARLDDLVNLPASRLSALLVVAAAALAPGASPSGAWRAMLRDARHHRSPNAGWPEAAMAGALGLALAGPRHYGGVIVEDAFMGAGGRRDADAADIRRALRIYRIADLLLIALAGMLAAGVFLLS